MPARFHRLDETHRERIRFACDGTEVEAMAGDSLLTAILTNAGWLRVTEFDHQPRAGFCLMGACQDCLVWTADGARLRACSTPVTPGLTIFTRAPGDAWPPLLS